MQLTRVSKRNKECFKALLESVDKDFSPALSLKIDFDEYHSKVIDKAKSLAIISDREMVGVVVYYDNREYLQITLICVLKKYRGRGYSKKLLEKIISNTNKEIRVITWKDNLAALSLYKCLGFKLNKTYVNKFGVDELLLTRI